MIRSVDRYFDVENVPEQIECLVVFSLFREDSPDALEDGSNIRMVHPVGVSIQSKGFSVEHHSAVQVSPFIVNATDHDQRAGDSGMVGAQSGMINSNRFLITRHGFVVFTVSS